MEAVTAARTAWHCEWDAAPSRVLEHHWPGVPNLEDVTSVEWDSVEPVDIITGGYPCQPFSAAGRRKGTGDERHLWPYVREAVRHLRPRLVVLENVAGHRSLGFDRVLGDMAEDGLDAWWTSVRASDVGAPHHRERLFILAAPAHAAGDAGRVRDGDGGFASDADRERRGQGAGQPVASAPELAATERGIGAPSDASNNRCERGWQARRRGAGPSNRGVGNVEWGAYAPAVRRWERLTRPAPAPTEPNRNGRARLNAAFAEWMMGLPAGWVTDPEIGLTRSQQLKAIGNGVCPQQAEAALRSLLSMQMGVAA